MKLAEDDQGSPSQVAFGRTSVSQVICLSKSQPSIYLVLEPTESNSSRIPTSATPGTRLRPRALLHRGGVRKQSRQAPGTRTPSAPLLEQQKEPPARWPSSRAGHTPHSLTHPGAPDILVGFATDWTPGDDRKEISKMQQAQESNGSPAALQGVPATPHATPGLAQVSSSQ